LSTTTTLRNDDSTSVGTLIVEQVGSDFLAVSKIYVGADGVNGGPVSLTNPLAVRLSDGSGAIATLPVSLASVPSHAVTNAGTFAVQVDGTALTRLTDIETNTDSGAVVGNGTAATSQRVTIASDSTGVIAATQSGAWNVTNVSGTISLPTGASTAAKQDTGNASLATLAGAVAGTEFQVDVLTMPTVTVTGTVAFSNSTIAVTNAGTFATQAAQSGTWNIANISGTVSLPTGPAYSG